MEIWINSLVFLVAKLLHSIKIMRRFYDWIELKCSFKIDKQGNEMVCHEKG